MKRKVNENERRTMGEKGPVKLLRRCTHYSRTQSVDIRHRESAIRRLSVTEGCDVEPSRGRRKVKGQ